MKISPLDLIIALIEIILVVFQFYDDLGAKIYGDVSTAFRKILAAQLFLFILYIIVKFQSERMRLEEISAGLKEFISARSEAVALNQEDFYARFQKMMSVATTFVGVTHLDKNPPNPRVGSVQEAYYNSVFRQIKTRKNIAFQRIARVSVEKREWLHKLVNDLHKCKNFTLGCYISEDDSSSLPCISVQLIDDRDIFLVAVSKHENLSGPRDVYIRDREIFSIWHSYFETQLLRRSLVIVKNGKIQQEAWAKVKQIIGDV